MGDEYPELKRRLSQIFHKRIIIFSYYSLVKLIKYEYGGEI